MTAKLTKMVVVPLDGSQNAIRSLDYLSLVFGSSHNVEVTLLYVLPSLPSMLIEDRRMAQKERLRLTSINTKNVQMAERILSKGKRALIGTGFRDEQIKTVYKEKKLEIARDICMLADDNQADAVIVSTRGRSRLEAFFMGEVARKLSEYCRICPVWIVSGVVKSKQVLIAVDSSENALRAVDHAGFILSGTDCQVTLFHTMRHLRRFVPKEVLEEAPELEELWKQKAGQEIGPYMKKAKEILLQTGLTETQVATKVVDGTRSAANDILGEARKRNCGTVVIGRRGQSGIKAFMMGSVTNKVLEASAGMTVAVV